MVWYTVAWSYFPDLTFSWPTLRTIKSKQMWKFDEYIFKINVKKKVACSGENNYSVFSCHKILNKLNTAQ